MKKRSILLIFFLSLLPLFSPSLHALKPRSKYFRSEEEKNQYLTTHYNLGCKYYNKKAWRKASSEFEKVIFYFPCSDAAAEASYYLAVSYFEMGEYDFANEEFSNYLKASQQPAFFEDAVSFKFCIAEHFKRGKKKHPFKMRYLPKWVSAQDSALTIYDEVAAALPNHELAVQALYSKADLLKEMREYRDSVEAYQLIIRRFPRHEIVPACYLGIADAYIRQSRIEFQNPDILALAELNARKFKDDFPRDERVAIAEDSILCIKELYAKGLCDLALFYERLKHPDAAAIYYQSAIEEFPDTNAARFCRSRLICLGYLEDEEQAPCSEDVQPPVVEGDGSVPCNENPVQPQTFMESNDEIDFYAPPENIEQDIIHYSLRKQREMKQNCVEEPCYGEEQTNSVIEGVVQPPPCPENQVQQSEPLWHYSVIKHRDQYVPCED